MSATGYMTIGVIGSGRMGADIAYFLSDFNYHLVWICIDEDEKSRQTDAYEKKLNRLFRNGLLDEIQLNHKKNDISISCSLKDLSSCDIIIETIHENAVDKARLFISLEPYISDHAVLVTNTSSIKPSLLVRDKLEKCRFAGLHFFYPVKLKNIVELIFTDDTDNKTIQTLRDFTDAIGKFRLEMHEDNGFVLNRIFLDLQAQAVRLHIDDGLGIDVIDGIIKNHLFPVGVFEFFDAVGIDIMHSSIINYTENLAGRDFYKPLEDYLADLVSRNRLGKKSGAGCYKYPSSAAEAVMPHHDIQLTILDLLRSLYINSAFKALEKNIWSLDDLEFAVKEYMGIDRGPFALAEITGRGPVRDLLLHYYEKTGFDAYRPSILL